MVVVSDVVSDVEIKFIVTNVVSDVVSDVVSAVIIKFIVVNVVSDVVT